MSPSDCLVKKWPKEKTIDEISLNKIQTYLLSKSFYMNFHKPTYANDISIPILFPAETAEL